MLIETVLIRLVSEVVDLNTSIVLLVTYSSTGAHHIQHKVTFLSKKGISLARQIVVLAPSNLKPCNFFASMHLPY